MDLITTTLIQTGLQGLFTYCGKGMVRAFKSLSEFCGNAKAPLYESVSSFWYEGVDNDGLNTGESIKIEGVVSLFIPLCPRHPRAIPGKQASTWIEMKRKEKQDEKKYDFVTQDFILWNDGVLVPPKARNGKAIIGLSDKFGYVGHGCLPLIIDTTNKKLNSIYNKLVDEQPSGYEAIVRGRLVPFTINIAQDFGLAYIAQNDMQETIYPDFVLEVFDISLKKQHNILTGTMWMGYGDNSIFPIYCHLLNKNEYNRALVALSAEYNIEQNQVIAVYDSNPFQYLSKNMPQLNENLLNTFNDY